MKAYIKTDGTMVVTAENITEEYALKKWNEENYNAPDHKVNLRIDLVYTPVPTTITSKETI